MMRAILNGEHTSISSLNGIDEPLANALRGIAQEGNIILPLDVSVLRKGETFKQWAARTQQSIIETTRRAAGGSFREAAERLGLTPPSLRGHLQRARRGQNGDLFEDERD
jgi:hypothetical protein